MHVWHDLLLLLWGKYIPLTLFGWAIGLRCHFSWVLWQYFSMHLSLLVDWPDLVLYLPVNYCFPTIFRLEEIFHLDRPYIIILACQNFPSWQCWTATRWHGSTTGSRLPLCDLDLNFILHKNSTKKLCFYWNRVAPCLRGNGEQTHNFFHVSLNLAMSCSLSGGDLKPSRALYTV